MKLLASALVALFAAPAFATVDAITSVWIPVQNIQDDEDFGVERAPVVGCYGLAQGPQLDQFISPYMVPTNVGCGGPKVNQDINALSCAKLIDAVEGPDYISFKRIVLDISACPYKDNKRFITMVRTAAARNFPQPGKGKEVELILQK